MKLIKLFVFLLKKRAIRLVFYYRIKIAIKGKNGQKGKVVGKRDRYALMVRINDELLVRTRVQFGIYAPLQTR